MATVYWSTQHWDWMHGQSLWRTCIPFQQLLGTLAACAYLAKMLGSCQQLLRHRHMLDTVDLMSADKAWQL